MNQIMGRLRKAGTCTIFTTTKRLQYITGNFKESAKEMAGLILSSRATNSLAAACFDVCDGVDAAASSVAVSVGTVAFNLPEFRRFCQSLLVRVDEFQAAGACTFCSIIGNRLVSSHINSDCPWNKNICNKCFQPGHNRSHCRNKACIVPDGFCVMCLMPVHEVYSTHSGRYGTECTSPLRDCFKPIVCLLYHNASLKVTFDAAKILWPPSNPKPATFKAYWDWLWHDSGDRIYGILKTLDAVMQSASAGSSGEGPTSNP